MRHEGDVRVSWTRPELIALREAIEVTPNFEGRMEVRGILKAALHAPRLRDVSFERELAQRFANRLVPVDMPTAMARAKLLTVLRGRSRREMLGAQQRRQRGEQEWHPPVTPAAPPVATRSTAAAA